MLLTVPDLFATVRSQRACRSFRPDAIDDALLRQVLEAATYAPSAENRQPWVFVVVRGKRLRQAIGDLNRQVWENGARVYSESRLPPAMMAAELLVPPPQVRPMAVVPLGWPEPLLGPPRRHPIETRTHRDRFGHRREACP
jgi:nitroreductase